MSVPFTHYILCAWLIILRMLDLWLVTNQNEYKSMTHKGAFTLNSIHLKAWSLILLIKRFFLHEYESLHNAQKCTLKPACSCINKIVFFPTIPTADLFKCKNEWQSARPNHLIIIAKMPRKTEKSASFNPLWFLKTPRISFTIFSI